MLHDIVGKLTTIICYLNVTLKELSVHSIELAIANQQSFIYLVPFVNNARRWPDNPASTLEKLDLSPSCNQHTITIGI